MDREGLMQLGGLTGALVIVCSTAYAIRRSGSTEADGRWPWAIVPAVAALAAWLVFQLDTLLSVVDDNGPGYPPTSAYGRYREATSGDADSPWGALAGFAYALIAGTLGIAALAARRRRDGLLVGLAFATGAAVTLPAIVPSLLSPAPGDELRFSPGNVSHGGSGLSTVTVCFTARTYASESSDELARSGPSLCLDLAPTSRARGLLDPASSRVPLATPPSTAVSSDDIADALEEQSLQPGDVPGRLGIPGIEVAAAHWTH